jgi:hypothetical protein
MTGVALLKIYIIIVQMVNVLYMYICSQEVQIETVQIH